MLRKLQFFLLLGTVFIIFFAIVHWDDVKDGTFYLHVASSLPEVPASMTSSERRTSEDSFIWKQSSRSVKPNLTIITSHLKHDQANSSLNFPGKFKTFDQIPRKALDHLIVDDHHGVIYCFVPKVACTNWKRVMIVLRFWRLFGRFSRPLMHHRLQNYTKFLFVRDPFVRLISAFRNKFALPNEEFYKKYASTMLQQAFAAGIRLSFTHFIQYLLDPQTEKVKPFNEHWQQMYRLCHPCQIDYDFVGKLETLDEDTEHLLRILGLDNQIHFPPGYRNRTAVNWERDWFANISVADRRKLYNLYEADFRLFGYDKPETLLHK
ncbi:hypothetical protein PO909_014898 [Leuciscus waleckii]